MIETVHPWERILLGLAFEAWHSVVHPPSQPIQDSKLLEESYAHCHSVTALHSRSFHLASALLPAPKRQAARALYAFCRVTDDLVDRSSGDVEANLRGWRQQVSTWHPPADDLVAVAWADTRARYHIPQRYVEQLIEGVGRDLHQSRYDTFEDLTTYRYGVADGQLMSMYITGFTARKLFPTCRQISGAVLILRDG